MSDKCEYNIGKYRGKFCIKWTDKGGRHRVSLGTTDRAEAEALARRLWSERQIIGVSTVGQIFDAWFGQRGKKADAQRVWNAWKAAKGFWENVRPDLVDAEMCRIYARQRGRAVNTIRNELVPLRTALRWAHDKGLIKAKPDFWMPARPESTVEHLTKAQFRRFLAGCIAPHVALFAQLAVLTGARSGALLELPWVRVELDKRIINLKRELPEDWTTVEPKVKPRAVVPINDRLLPLLVEAKEGAQTPFVIELDGKRIFSVRKGFEAASARSGVHCTPHMLRHSAAVWMAEARTPMPEIAAYLGHTTTEVTERTYARFHPDYLRRASKALEW
jgi:integrase